MINVFQPSLGEEEIAAIRQVFKENWPGRGLRAEHFEQAFADYLDTAAAHMISITSCTEGLFYAIKALNLHEGDEVILPSCGFIGMANAVMENHCKPVFCDVDPRTLNPTAEMIEAEITKRTGAIMILHYGGVPPDMPALVDLADRRGLWLVEDCAISEATRYDGKACGTFGHIGVWSFDAMKSISTGDGGMLWFRNYEHIRNAKVELYLGMTDQSGYITSPNRPRWWEFDMIMPGRRSLMNDLTACIGIEQLKKLPAATIRRRSIHDKYNHELVGLDWLKMPPPFASKVESSYAFYWIQCGRRDELANYLKKNGVYTTFRYWPLHQIPIYGHRGKPLPGTGQAAQQTLLLPLHQGLSDADVGQVIELVRKFK